MNITTEVFKVDSSNFDETIKRAALILKKGGLVAFPTETVYGLGADALNPEAVRKIFEAKGRPADNPLIVHIAAKEHLHDLAMDVPAHAAGLVDAFWPGPLTLVLKRKNIVPDITTGGLDTVAVRMPDNQIALELIRQAGTPIAAPSANVSGRPSPTDAGHVIADLAGRIDAVIDGGSVRIGVESTVVDVTGDIPVILRPGGIGIEDIRKCAGDAIIGYTDRAVGEEEAVRSPGMKYTHYSPQTEVVLVEGSGAEVSDRISELVAAAHEKGTRVGLLVTDETASHVSTDEMYSLGERDRPEQAARSLFTGLRWLDGRGVDVIIVDGSVNHEGVGAAVLNRLRKAAGRIIEISPK
ncbi:MAG: threonylcarbamoyl-AMP synthase [Methanosarcinaceae archaeon]|nr:threonylcarbamoyl-AMP synthase [Methanosarcinaceae archaeon]